MEYKAIEAANVESLSKRINELIKKGWEPIGGISVSLCETDESQYFVCAQAMLRQVSVQKKHKET